MVAAASVYVGRPGQYMQVWWVSEGGLGLRNSMSVITMHPIQVPWSIDLQCIALYANCMSIKWKWN